MSLADRWSKEEKDAAAQIVNDISEDIDNRDSREALRAEFGRDMAWGG